MKKRSCVLLFVVLFVFFISAGFFVLGLAMIVASGDHELSGEIVVIELKGKIFESQELVRKLEKAGEKDQIKAVVFRIDSPGGLVSPSEEIYRALVKLRENKKVVASLGSVAASGGYYVACGADKIVANAGTITGSIGVRIDHVNIADLVKLTRVKPQVLTSGPFKDMGSPLRALSPADEKILRHIMAQLYEQFKGTVGQERKLSGKQLDNVSDGRVFTGEEAMQLGLVDSIGSLQDAIEVAAKLVGIEGKPDVSYPHKKTSHWIRLFIEDAVQSVVSALDEAQRTPQALWQL